MRLLASALFSTLLAAALDLGVAFLRGAALRGPEAAHYLLAGLGLYGLVALAIGGIVALFRCGLPRPVPRPTLSGVLAVAAAAGIYTALLFAIQRTLAARLSNPVFAAAGVALLGLVALAVFALVLPPLRRVSSTRLGRLSIALCLCGAGGLLGVVLVRVEWRVVRFAGPIGALALGAGMIVGAGLALPRWAAWASVPATAIALGVTALWLPAPVAVAASDHGLALGGLLGLARTAADGDGDGFAGSFAGGDCDDRRADVHPAARDVPGNGVDENCAGGDARPRVERELKRHAAEPGVRNLLLVTIDALRADRVGVSLTPRLMDLAARGARFSHVWAQAPNTPRSFPSVIASRYPSEIRWVQQFRNYSPLLDEEQTVFEVLARAGIRTVGIFSHFYFAPERNLGQGFAEWDNAGAKTIAESNTDIASPRIVARVTEKLRALSRGGERFALWTHLFEPHSRYVEHAEFPVGARGIPGLIAKYDAEIRFVDRQVGVLVDALAQAGLGDDTAVVVFSDHGEAFGEHRHYFHGQALHEEQLRVPLVIVVPGMAPRLVNDRAMLVDLAPTLCELLGVAPLDRFRGESLLGPAAGRALPTRPIYAELLPAPSWPHAARAYIDGDTKLIDRVSDNVVELYDLRRDPDERSNLASAAPGQARNAKAALVRFTEAELDGD